MYFSLSSLHMFVIKFQMLPVFVVLINNFNCFHINKQVGVHYLTTGDMHIASLKFKYRACEDNWLM